MTKEMIDQKEFEKYKECYFLNEEKIRCLERKFFLLQNIVNKTELDKAEEVNYEEYIDLKKKVLELEEENARLNYSLETYQKMFDQVIEKLNRNGKEEEKLA